MTWLYRLQSRANLTTAEGTALVVLAVALAGGLVARHTVAHASPPPSALYAAADAAFGMADAQGAASDVPLLIPADPRAPATAPAPVDSSVAGSATATFATDEAIDEPADAAMVAEATVRASAGRSRSGRKPPPVPTNINTDSEQELQRLPRVGPAIAARIVEHRRQNGRFRRAEDIQEVRGIGPKTFEQMAPWIRL